LLVLSAGVLTGSVGPGISGGAMDNCGTMSGGAVTATFGGKTSGAIAGVIAIGAIPVGVAAC